jgi:hypothetical protein
MWFALTQPPYGTPMPQSGRRPQHQKWTNRRDPKSNFVRCCPKADIAKPPLQHSAIRLNTPSEFNCSGHVRFSKRPFGVKRLQTIHRYSVYVAHSPLQLARQKSSKATTTVLLDGTIE